MAKAFSGPVTLKIWELKPITDVPNVTEETYNYLRNEMERFGLIGVPYIDEDMNVVTGKLSVLAARAIGRVDINVFLLPKLTKVHRLNMRLDHERGLSVVDIARKYQKSVPLTRKILNGED